MPGQITSTQYFRVLITIHSALISGQVMFAVIGYVVKGMGSIPNSADLEKIFMYLVPILTIAGLLTGNMIFKARLNTAKNNMTLASKLTAYRSAIVTRDAMFEFPSIFAIIGYMLTGQLIFLGCTALVIIVFILTLPTKERTINDLELSSTEAGTVNDPNGLVG